MHYIELNNGTQVSSEQFKARNPNVNFSGAFPSIEYLESIGAFRIDITSPVTIEDVYKSVQKMLDASSISRGYDSITTECSYATSTGSYGAEAQVTVDWRDAVWTHVFAHADDGLSTEDLMADLPVRP